MVVMYNVQENHLGSNNTGQLQKIVNEVFIADYVRFYRCE
jgi:hypothetical protein